MSFIYGGNGNLILNADNATIAWSPYGKVKSVEAPFGEGGTTLLNDIIIEAPIVQTASIEACSTITGNNTVAGSNTVTFEAGQNITLLAGFHVKPTGSGSFTASIRPPDEPCETPPIPVATDFGYDAAQNRVLKSVEKDGIVSKTYYIRDAQGNMMATYRLRNDSLTWQEQHLYGSSRLGIFETGVTLDETTINPYYVENEVTLRGKKRYELSNHLGNVLTVIRDLKQPKTDPIGGYTYFETFTESATDYYPFGLEIPNRSYSNTTFSNSNYRFGFNGKESDRNGEWGSSVHYDYGFRIYDPSIARFLSVDPLTSSYPWYTPYQFAGNKPIYAIDLDGLEEFPASTPFPEGYLDSRLEIDMNNAPDNFTTNSGKTVSTWTNAEGAKGNHAWYWEQVRQNVPDAFDANNNWAIDNGFAPKANEAFLDEFEQFRSFRNQTLDHHHLNHGNIAHGLPKELHRGAGHTKLWHRFGKSLIIVGALVGLQDIANGQPISAIDPYGTSIIADEMAAELNNDLLGHVFSKGYTETIDYIQNCQSCGDFGIFYASEFEMNDFVQGKMTPDFSSDYFLPHTFFRSTDEANSFFDSVDDKVINFGILFKNDKKSGKSTPKAIFSLPRE